MVLGPWIIFKEELQNLKGIRLWEMLNLAHLVYKGVCWVFLVFFLDAAVFSFFVGVPKAILCQM